MEQVYKELEEMRSAMETLTGECRAKSQLSETLRRAHDEQLGRLQEAKIEIEKQTKEIDAKAEEISVGKQMYEDLRSSFCEKESVLKNLSLANENLRTSFAEKLMRLEGENKQVILALDEARQKVEEQDWVICAYKEEIEGLKGLLSMSQKKCLDAEQRAQAPKELKRRDDMILELEREKGEVEDRLKWKSEQFSHLEEAHDKIQDEFRAGKKEWEMEKSNLVYEVSSLQNNLDSQTRVAEELRSQLQMCHQALAHEESRRKLLEIQMAESKALYDNVVSEYEEARLNIESLTARRDEEIAALRNSLATKATLAKDLEFRRTHLELENQELRSSLKELQEAQINGVDSAASFKTMRQKFKVLEQAHRGCSKKLNAKCAEWSAETEKLNIELNECLFKLSCKDNQLLELQAKFEGTHSLLMQQKLENEEISVVLMVLQSKFMESCSNLEDPKLEMEQCSAQVEERIALLLEQLEKKNSALVRAQYEIKRERDRLDSLQTRTEYLEPIEQEYFLMQKELDSYKGMLAESSRNLDRLKEKAAWKENEPQEDMRKASDALDLANSALAEKSGELSKVAFELHQLKLVAEQMEKMRNDLETELNKHRDESLSYRRDLEESLVAKIVAEKALEEGKESFFQTVEEKDKIIKELQKQLVLLEEGKREFEASALAKLETKESCEKENKRFLQFVEDVDRRLKCIQTVVDLMEQNYVQRENEILMKLEGENTRFLQVMEEKENVIADIQQQVLSYGQDFTRSVEDAAAFKLRDLQFEISTLNEALEKIMAAHILEEQEIQYRNILIVELEVEIGALQLKSDFEEKLSFRLKNCLHQLEAKSAADLLEKEREKVHVENKLKSLLCYKTTLEDRVEELEADKKALHEIIAQFSSVREELVEQMMGFGDLIGTVCDKGEEVRRNWDKVVQKATNEDDTLMNIEVEDLFGSKKLDGRNYESPPRNKAGQIPDRRSPLKEHNC